jgi:hypothetical protein
MAKTKTKTLKISNGLFFPKDFRKLNPKTVIIISKGTLTVPDKK